MRIALAGNPNSGKTTLYNAITGKNEKVGNWAGVTVEKKESPIKKSFSDADIVAVDLPGAYSMSPFTSEESVTSDFIKNENPDVIINIVDATNLSRSLFFTTQLLELGIPVVALNKSDINDKKHTKINQKALSEKLGCPVIKTVSSKKKGLDLLIKTAVSLVGTTPTPNYLGQNIDLTDRSLVLLADKNRFEFVNKIVNQVENRKILTKDRNVQDKIDAVLTNSWIGIPIFAVVMFLVFYISQSTLGTWIAEGYELQNGFTVPGLVTLLEIFQGFVAELVSDATPILRSLLVDGIIGGVIAVVGFLPLVMIMYFLIQKLFIMKK